MTKEKYIENIKKSQKLMYYSKKSIGLIPLTMIFLLLRDINPSMFLLLALTSFSFLIFINLYFLYFYEMKVKRYCHQFKNLDWTDLP